MHKITLFSISGLIIILTYLPLFLFIIFKGKTRTSKVFSFHILSVCLWGVCSLILGTNLSTENQLKFWNITFVFVIFIPVFFQHAILLLTDRKLHIYLIFIYTQAVFYGFFSISGLYNGSLRLVYDVAYFNDVNYNFLISFIIWVLISSTAHIQLLLYYIKKFPEQREQRYILILSIIGFIGGMSNFLPVFNFNIYPLGNFLIPIHSISITYAILKYQLLDIRIAIKRSIVYPTLVVLISILYLITVFIFENYVQEIFRYQSLLFGICVSFLLGLLFFPLRNKVHKVVDRHFFRGSSEEIASLNEQLLIELAQSEKYKSLSTLSSGIGHEIKNPLTAIKTFTEHLPSKLEDKEFLLKFSRLVGAEVDRINGLVNQLSEYGRPAPLTLRSTNIYGLIDDILDILSSNLIKNRINLIKLYPQNDALTLNIDPNQIKQALLNMCLNSIESMKNGGELEISTELDKSYFKLKIRDTGTGIPKKDLPQIFDPFFSSKDMNTGLGLSITQTIIQQHQGKIKVKSKIGNGTEFTLQLPLNTSIS